jgi:hypothetical protein
VKNAMSLHDNSEYGFELRFEFSNGVAGVHLPIMEINIQVAQEFKIQ